MCPVTAVNEYNYGLDRREATYMRYPRRFPAVFTIDREACLGCGLCEKVCLAEAVCYDDEPRRSELEVGAVILAPGNEVFDPSPFDTYNYCALPQRGDEPGIRAHPERLRALPRPPDAALRPGGAAKDRLAAVRGLARHPPLRQSYCSGVCCMYAIKEAVIAKEHAHGDLDTAIFFMDMRTYGKDFEQYYNRAKDHHGVRFIRSRVHTIDATGDGDLEISYVDRRRADQVGSVQHGGALGRLPGRARGPWNWPSGLGIDLNENRFAETASFTPVATSRAGRLRLRRHPGPQGHSRSRSWKPRRRRRHRRSCSSEARWTEATIKEKPVETNVIGEPPRVGRVSSASAASISAAS